MESSHALLSKRPGNVRQQVLINTTIYVKLEILAGIKLGGWALNHHCKNIGGFKFGGSVRDCHTYICKYEVLAGFNFGGRKLDCQTAKFNFLPNFPAICYIQEYNVKIFPCQSLILCIAIVSFVRVEISQDVDNSDDWRSQLGENAYKDDGDVDDLDPLRF